MKQINTSKNYIRVICFLIYLVSISWAVPLFNSSDSLVLNSIDTVAINNLLPIYYFRFIVEESDQSPIFESAEIRVMRGNDSIPCQIIKDSEEGIYNYSLVDINFDGYKDIQIDNPMMASGVNTPSYFLLFNPKTNLFEKSSEFSGFSNVYIDSVNKEISDMTNWGNRQYCEHNRLFRVENNHLVLINEEYSDCNSSYTKSLINKKFVIVKRETLKYEKDAKGNGSSIILNEELVNNKLKIRKKTLIKYVEDTNSNPDYLFENCYGKYKIVSEKYYK